MSQHRWATQVKKAERKMPWVKFAEAQEKFKRSKEALQVAQRNLEDLKAEVAQSAGPLKCEWAGSTPAHCACIWHGDSQAMLHDRQVVVSPLSIGN